MYSFFAFALKVCKKCYYDPKHFFRQNINMGIKIIKNFMLISNLLMPYCNKTLRRIPPSWPDQFHRSGEWKIFPLLGPGLFLPQITSFSVVPEYSGDFLCGEKKERAQRGIEPTVLTSIYKGIIIACSTCGLIAIVRNFSFRMQPYWGTYEVP